MASQRYEHAGPFPVDAGKVYDHTQQQQAQGWVLCAAYPSAIGTNGAVTQVCLVYAREVGHWESEYVAPP